MISGQDPARKNLPKVPGPVTPEIIKMIARDEARKEIVATSTALANKVQEVMGKSMGPLNDRIGVLRAEVHGTSVSLNAIAELLVEKGIFTREEIEARVVAQHEKEMARQKEISQRKAEIASGKAQVLPEPPPSEPAEGEPAP